MLLVEAVAGLYAIYFMVRHHGEVNLTRYWLFVAYLAILWLSALSSADAAWVCAQALALTSVVIFFIVFVEGYPDLQAVQPRVFLVFAAAIALTGVASVIYLKVFGIAAIDTTVVPWRYKGLFSKPADVAAASGLLVVISAFSSWPLLLRLSGGAIGLLNLWLSGSRNALAAAVVSMVVTPLVCGKKRWLILWGARSHRWPACISCSPPTCRCLRPSRGPCVSSRWRPCRGGRTYGRSASSSSWRSRGSGMASRGAPMLMLPSVLASSNR